MTNNDGSKPVLVHPAAGQRGMTALHFAAYCNDADAVDELLAAGASPEVVDDNGWTPLHWSLDMAQAGGEPRRVVAALLRNSASANAADRSGFTVLMMACGRNNANILDQLISAGASVHSRTVNSTPLHEAAGCNFCEAIELLLRLGADPTLVDGRERTPEQLAVEYEFTESADVLRAARIEKS